jgi:hypothetical protein
MTGTNRPFRWDLVRPDQLGTLLGGVAEPDLWFVEELTECAAKVLARCGDGELYFVGRSVDSMYDLLSGALSGTPWQDRVHQLPLSMAGAGTASFGERDAARLRANLTAAGLSPGHLARGRRPTVFVDLVYTGYTFKYLYRYLRTWIDEDREAWSVIRRKLRFIGITWREKSGPHAWRWQQNAAWTAELPSDSVRGVSVSGNVWGYFGNHQGKLTKSFSRKLWDDESVATPSHDDRTREALAEAVALVEAGRARSTRDLLVKHLSAEPARLDRWLRTLITSL